MKKSTLAFSVILLASCGAAKKKGSSSVDQDKISTDYTVEYTNDGTQLAGDVSFTGDAKGFHITSFELDGNSNVTLDGKALVATPVPIIGGVTYDFRIDPANKPHTLVYTDNNGKTYTNTFSYEPIMITAVDRYMKDHEDGEWYKDNESPLDSSGVVILKLTRAPKDGEHMDVYVESATDDFENGSYEIQTTDDKGEGFFDATDSTIMFWPDMDTDFLKSKKVTYKLRCYQDVDAVAPAAGGKISYTWETKENSIELNLPNGNAPKGI
ncbi:MAG TPA: hypothetical protein VL651_08410 [Bacteroidia bacterium]|jgi:hypothetical protein|nr:hypothetical protein [Bacteroidia bacterium]